MIECKHCIYKIVSFSSQIELSEEYSIECNSWVSEVKIPLIFYIVELIFNHNIPNYKERATSLLIGGICFC